MWLGSAACYFGLWDGGDCGRQGMACGGDLRLSNAQKSAATATHPMLARVLEREWDAGIQVV
jgi:hypothetical protein